MSAIKIRKNVGVGFRVHIGWATAIAVARLDSHVVALDRQILLLFDPRVIESRGPYHAVKRVEEIAVAAEMVRRGMAAARSATARTVSAYLKGLSAGGLSIVGAGILLGSLRPASEMRNPMIQIHLGDVDIFRTAIYDVANRNGLPTVRLTESDLYEKVAQAMSRTPETISRILVAVERAWGRPWRNEEKRATLIGLLALMEGERRKHGGVDAAFAGW